MSTLEVLTMIAYGLVCYLLGRIQGAASQRRNR